MKVNFFTTRNMVALAMLTAIGYALSWLEFPIFPPAPFLKLDFSNVPTMLGGYMFGFPGAIIIEGIKQLIIWPTKSSTGGVGELANFVMTASFVIVPSLMYRWRKGLPSVFIGMGVGVVLQVISALLCNRFITFPLFAGYLGMEAGEAFALLWPYVLGFNAIKAVAISVVTLLLYKRLSYILKWMPKKQKTLAKKGQWVYNNNMQKVFVSKSESDTLDIAHDLAESFVGGEVVLLIGDLGAGKTVFAKGVAKALGITADVKSPTFTLSCEYEGRLKLLHIDAYRLKNGEEAEACGLNELFGDKNTVTLIEWPSQIESVLPSKSIAVNINRIDDNTRELIINEQ